MARPNRSRDKVLVAAAELAAERGVSATTVDEIAARAGVAKGSVYYSFPSKEAIFESLIDEAVARVSGRIRDAREGAEPGVALGAVARAMLEGLEANPHVAKVVVGELFRTDRPWREALAGHRAVLLDELGAALAADGRPASGLDAAARLGALVMVGFERLAFSPERTIDECVAAVVSGAPGTAAR